MKTLEVAVRFVEINEAKEVLKDFEKRKPYDAHGENWERAEPQTPPVVPHQHNPVFIMLTCLESHMKQKSR